MMKKLLAGIASLTLAFTAVISSGTLQTEALETTTEANEQEVVDPRTEGIPMTIRVLDESDNDELYLPGVEFQVTSVETEEVIYQFVYDGGDFTFVLEYGKSYTIYAISVPEGYQLQNEGVYAEANDYEMDYTFRAKNPSITTTYATTTDPSMATADSEEPSTETHSTSATESTTTTTATTKSKTTETTVSTTPDTYVYTGTFGTTTPDWLESLLHSQTTTEDTGTNSTTPDWLNSQTTTEDTGTNTTTPDWLNSQTTTEDTGTNSTTPDLVGVFFGDINLDGRINLCDTVLLNQYCSGAVSLNPTAQENGDCNQDSEVNADDSILLLKFLIRMVDKLPVFGD